MVKKAKRPRIVTNNEVLELVQSRQKLHREFPAEDRDPGIDMLFSSLQHNLMNPEGMGFNPRVSMDQSNNMECDACLPLKHRVLQEFVTEVRELVSSCSQDEIQILPSEIVQLINIRPKLDGLVKLIMPERGVIGVNEEAMHESIAALVKEKLCVPSALCESGADSVEEDSQQIHNANILKSSSLNREEAEVEEEEEEDEMDEELDEDLVQEGAASEEES